MARTIYDLPELHRINGAVTGTPLFSYTREVYSSTPEIAAQVYQSAREFDDYIAKAYPPKKPK